VYHLIERPTSTQRLLMPGGTFIMVTTDPALGVTLTDPAKVNVALVCKVVFALRKYRWMNCPSDPPENPVIVVALEFSTDKTLMPSTLGVAPVEALEVNTNTNSLAIMPSLSVKRTMFVDPSDRMMLKPLVLANKNGAGITADAASVGNNFNAAFLLAPVASPSKL